MYEISSGAIARAMVHAARAGEWTDVLEFNRYLWDDRVILADEYRNIKDHALRPGPDSVAAVQRYLDGHLVSFDYVDRDAL